MSRTRLRVNPHSIVRLRTKWFWVRVQLQSLHTNLILTWSENCVLKSGSIDGQVIAFAITDKTLCFRCNFVD